MIGSGELLIIGVLFLTTLNCLVTYLFSSYAVKKASVENDYSGAIKSLRIYDRYLFTPLTMISAIAYVALSYNYFIEILEVSDYFITFATMGGFIFTLVTTFFSRLCYCYACNFVLKTKLNEYECFMVNAFSLAKIFFPIFVLSFVIPTIYVLPYERNIRDIIVAIFLVTFVILYILTSTGFNILSLNAHKIKDEKLVNIISDLFRKHGIKRFRLYYWDSSRSNDSNAMISGLFRITFFISTSLIESINEKELEAVILHEIAHVKYHHVRRKVINQAIFLFAIVSVLYYLIVSNVTNVGVLLIIMLAFVLLMGLEARTTKKQENEADLYVAKNGLGEELISALRKISLEDDEDYFHGSVEERKNKISKK